LGRVLRLDPWLRALINISSSSQAISHIKAVGPEIAVATALAVAAAIFTALAILAGFVSLFVWLQPLYGTLPTICIVAGATGLDRVGVHCNRSGRRKKATGTYQSVGRQALAKISDAA
jgi:ABC-type glucose/galactose transport system permease subunit